MNNEKDRVIEGDPPTLRIVTDPDALNVASSTELDNSRDLVEAKETYDVVPTPTRDPLKYRTPAALTALTVTDIS